MTLHSFMRICRWIVYLYAAVLIVQQLCILFGWPMFNGGNHYKSIWKLNSLMSEPARAVFILFVVVFYHSLATRHLNSETNIWQSIRRCPLMWACYVWVLFTTDNASAYVWFPLSIVPLLSRRNIIPSLSVAACLLIILCVVYPLEQNRQFRRALDTAQAFVSLDPDKIEEADLSASCRINPSIYGARAVGFTRLDDWVGHGVDADSGDLPGAGNGNGCAGMLFIWYNYGAIPEFLLWALIISVGWIRREPATLLMVAAMMFRSGGTNDQPIWCMMTFALLYRTIVAPQSKILTAIPFKTLLRRAKAGKAEAQAAPASAHAETAAQSVDADKPANTHPAKP